MAAAFLSKTLLMFWISNKTHPMASEQSYLAIFEQNRFLRRDISATNPIKTSHCQLHQKINGKWGTRSWACASLLGPLSNSLTLTVFWGQFLSFIVCFIYRHPSHLCRGWCGDKWDCPVSLYTWIFIKVFPENLLSKEKEIRDLILSVSVCQLSLLLFFQYLVLRENFSFSPNSHELFRL